jgi:glycosyltransferase involved in cell wall biosynthesis
MKSLYICYFGIRESLVQNQVLPYLRELVKGGNQMHLLTFEKADRNQMSGEDVIMMREALLEQGIAWSDIRYHGSPKILSTLYDVLAGARFIIKAWKKNHYDILHARALVPAVMARVARFVGRLQTKILFDLRGLIVEEYLDAGVLSNNNPLVPLMRKLELGSIASADGVVVLTDAIKEELFPDVVNDSDSRGRPIERIPCCFDEAKFHFPTETRRREAKERLGLQDRFVGIYTGSVSGVYLIDEMCDVFSKFREAHPGFFPIVLSRGDLSNIERKLERRGFSSDQFMLASVKPSEIAAYLSASDFAFAFYSPTFSRLATSPTKNSEYLAMGLPILTNSGVGDTEQELTEDRIGIVIKDFSDESVSAAVIGINNLLSEGAEIRERCRKAAEARYSLEYVGGPSYRRVYQRLTGGESV